jgi:hypothetical protein
MKGAFRTCLGCAKVDGAAGRGREGKAGAKVVRGLTKEHERKI